MMYSAAALSDPPDAHLDHRHGSLGTHAQCGGTAAVLRHAEGEGSALTVSTQAAARAPTLPSCALHKSDRPAVQRGTETMRAGAWPISRARR